MVQVRGKSVKAGPWLAKWTCEAYRVSSLVQPSDNPVRGSCDFPGSHCIGQSCSCCSASTLCCCCEEQAWCFVWDGDLQCCACPPARGLPHAWLFVFGLARMRLRILCGALPPQLQQLSDLRDQPWLFLKMLLAGPMVGTDAV